MLALLLLVGGLSQTSSTAQASPTPNTASAKAPPTLAKEADTDPSALLKVKRIFVESFGDDVVSKELQAMIVSSLVASKRFKVTENRERADAILKGVALEKTSHELHAYGESTSVGAASGASSGEVTGSVVNGNGTVSGSSSGGFIARHMGTSDSSVNTETLNEARVAVRLVDPDGDVIWTSTQESKGGKYQGASADVADKCVKQLLRDMERLEGGSVPTKPPVPVTTSPH